jgi:LPXTG-motif cell wall-anchored protein/uncharacterized repeat protein (TIGR01451 family)
MGFGGWSGREPVDGFHNLEGGTVSTTAWPRRWAKMIFAAGLGVVAGIAPTPFTSGTAMGAVNDNPDLAASCGIDVVLVLDESGSIESADAVDDVEAAVRALLDGLAGTGSRVRIAEFSTNARDAVIGGSTDFQTVDATFRNAVETYLTGHPSNQSAQTATGYNPGYGQVYTNWEAGLARADGVGDAGPGGLVVFVTDGQPNTIGTSGSSSGGTTNATNAAAAAHDELNLIKGAGVHVLGIGVGAASSDTNFNLLVDTIAPDPNQVWLGVGPLDIRTVDAIRVSSFDALDDALRTVVFALCAPSVSITKTDATGAPVGDWDFTGLVDVFAPAAAADTYEWASPPLGVTDDDGTGNDAGTTVATTSSGTALFQWVPGSIADPKPYDSTFSFTETLPTGWALSPQQPSCNVERLESDGTLTTLTDVVLVPAALGDSVTFVLERNGDVFVISPSDIVTCTVTNLRPELPVPRVIKGFTAGNDTIAELGEPGGQVVIPVVVHNDATTPQGDAMLIALTDDVHGDITTSGHDGIVSTTCAVPQFVVAGGSYGCQFTVEIDQQPGSITDTVTATLANAAAPEGVTASDTATIVVNDLPSAIDVVKTADPAVVLEPGGAVTYRFEVRNLEASADLVTIDSLTDTILGDLDGQGTCVLPQQLQPGESYHCELTATVTGNAHDVHLNVVTASGYDDDGAPVSDTDDATVTIGDVLPAISVEKTANPTEVPESGAPVTYSFVVRNLAGEHVTITSLVDNLLGDLAGRGTCSVPIELPVNAAYGCELPVTVGGPAGHVHHNTVTATGSDDDGNTTTATDDARVTVVDEPSVVVLTKTADPVTVPELGADVTFTVLIDNQSAADTVTITSLTDSIFGDLDGQGTCVVPQTIAAGTDYSCSFVAFVGGNAGTVHVDVVTASGFDDDQQPVTASDDAVVTVTDVPSAIVVTKTADPIAVPETGGEVTFMVRIENTSPVDVVTIASLTDSVYGDLNGTGTCSLPQTLVVGGSYECTFTDVVSGNALDVHTNVVTAAGVDDDGVAVTDADDASVELTDVLPEISVSKTASPVEVPEPGGTVTFTVEVTNLGLETLTLTSLADDVYGDLDGQGTCAVPQPLAAGGTYTCTFDGAVAGEPGDVHTNTVGAVAVDDDGNGDTASDDAEVTFADVVGAITVVKTANPGQVREPGAAVTFTFVVTNTSTFDTVTITSLVDDVLGDLDGVGTCEVPFTLLPGASRTCVVTEDVAGVDGDVHTNVVTVTGVDDDGVTLTATDDATVLVIEQLVADLAIEKTASTAVTGRDRLFDWTLEVTNLGPATGGTAATDVVVTDIVPANLVVTDVESDDFACTVTGQTVTCTKGSMAIGETAEIVITVRVAAATPAGTITNVANVTSQTPDPDLTNNSDQATVDVVVQEPPTTPPPTLLPATGSSATQPLMWFGVVLLGAGVIAIALVRRRSAAIR